MRGAAPTFHRAVPRRTLLKALYGTLAALTIAACDRADSGAAPTESAADPRLALVPDSLGAPSASFSVAGASAAAAPSGRKVLLFHSDPNQVAYVRSSLAATGLFAAEDIAALGIGSTPPTLEQLAAYDCAIVWTSVAPANPAGNGDRLRQYVDAGGGVVLLPFAYSERSDPWEMQGGIMADGYSPLDLSTTRETVFPRSLNFATALASDPVLEGVADFTFGGNSTYLALTLDPGATLVASDNFGAPLIAMSRSRRVAGINVYPG
ncbi:MAG TPA: hypothetical protein VFS05_16565, partial [Gemmatimonadaceae bacterium]|nr:hypothetical protein [Gemmatimonadaceae bacterium]